MRRDKNARMPGWGRYAVVLGLIAALSPCGQLAQAADWPNFRGPNRDGKSAETGLLNEWPEGGPTLRWAKEDLGHGFSSVAVANDVLYTTGLEGKIGHVYALNLDGSEKWKASYGPGWTGQHPGTRATPTVYDGNLYIMSGHGRVVCLDAKNGEEKWAVDTAERFGARNISWGMTESLLVRDDKLICTPGGVGAVIAALNRNTGETIWACKEVDEKSGYCSPYVIERGAREILVTMTGKSLVGFDWTSGSLLWQYAHPVSYDIHAVSPVYEDGRLYITAGYGGERGAMLELSEDGTKITKTWTDKKLDCHIGGLIVHEGHIYGTGHQNNGGKWVCMNLETGQVVAEIAGVGKGAITFANGKIYGYGEGGAVGLINPSPQDFRLISSFKITKGSKPHWAHPTVANGRLYIRHGNALMCFDIAAPPGR